MKEVSTQQGRGSGLSWDVVISRSKEIKNKCKIQAFKKKPEIVSHCTPCLHLGWRHLCSLIKRPASPAYSLCGSNEVRIGCALLAAASLMVFTPFSATSHKDFRQGWLSLVEVQAVAAMSQAELTKGRLATLLKRFCRQERERDL